MYARKIDLAHCSALGAGAAYALWQYGGAFIFIDAQRLWLAGGLANTTAAWFTRPPACMAAREEHPALSNPLMHHGMFWCLALYPTPNWTEHRRWHAYGPATPPFRPALEAVGQPERPLAAAVARQTSRQATSNFRQAGPCPR